MHYSNLAEVDTIISLPDGKKIHGELRGEISGKPVVVMMHGRPGSAHDILEYLGARYLYEHGYTTLRLNMYDFGEAYRDLVDCTLDTHIADFETVIDYVRLHNPAHIFATGHSYGGLTILRSKAELDGVVLWDPSHGILSGDQTADPKYPEKMSDDLLIGLGGNGYILPRAAVDYDKALGDTTAWISDKQYPIKIIAAGKGALTKYGKMYYDAAHQPKAFVILEEAGHSFRDSDDVMERLFRETSEWFDAQLKV